MQLVAGDFSVFSVIRGTGEHILLKIWKNLSFKTKVDFTMNSLILSPALFWSVFSWSTPSSSFSHSYPRAVSVGGSAQSHSTQKALYTSSPFSGYVTYPCFFRMLKNCHSLLFPLLFFEGRRGKQWEETLVVWELLSALGPFSTPAIRKMSLFSVHIIYT